MFDRLWIDQCKINRLFFYGDSKQIMSQFKFLGALLLISIVPYLDFKVVSYFSIFIISFLVPEKSLFHLFTSRKKSEENSPFDFLEMGTVTCSIGHLDFMLTGNEQLIFTPVICLSQNWEVSGSSVTFREHSNS